MEIKVTNAEIGLIVTALKAMKESYTFIRGWGKIGREEQLFDNLIKKIITPKVKEGR